MIVPDHWAEARCQHKAKGKQITVRRFGWSVTTLEDAQRMAEQRAAEALRRLVAGERLHKTEQKRAYNGADGVPIREEVVARVGEEVITRNAYGARCLNTPRALFADIDGVGWNPAWAHGFFLALFAVASLLIAYRMANWKVAVGLLFASLLLSGHTGSTVTRIAARIMGGPEALLRRRVRRFLKKYPDWNLRFYRTPAGFRLLAVHRPFEALDPLVTEFFRAIGTDPMYVRMCKNQRCFRARLTAKPWRIGISSHLRPRPGVWPVRPEHLSRRLAWIQDYEAKAAGAAACRFVESLGSGRIADPLRSVVELHDRESRALSRELPLA